MTHIPVISPRLIAARPPLMSPSISPQAPPVVSIFASVHSCFSQSFYIFISMSFTSPLPSLNPIFLPFPPIHMLLIQPSFHSSLHPSPRPCVVSSPGLSGRSLYPSFFLPLHLSPSATLLLPLITPSRRSFSLCACPHVFFSPPCRPDGSLSDNRGHGCLSLLSLSARSCSQFISHSPLPQSPPVTGAFQPPPLAAR